MTREALAAIAADPDHAAILLDFDGTLAPIVARPEDAGIAPGARDVLASLAARYLLVAVISGRPFPRLAELVGVDGVRVEGLYGLAGAGGVSDALRAEIEAATAGVEGVRVEPKGPTIAVHYRGAEDPAAARSRLAPPLQGIASVAGYDLFEGKMVFELAPAGESRKGGAVKRLVAESGARSALYAGDDLPDLEAFAALDELAGHGVATVKVAVGGAETPEALTAAAEVVVPDPNALIALMRELV